MTGYIEVGIFLGFAVGSTYLLVGVACNDYCWFGIVPSHHILSIFIFYFLMSQFAYRAEDK